MRDAVQPVGNSQAISLLDAQPHDLFLEAEYIQKAEQRPGSSSGSLVLGEGRVEEATTGEMMGNASRETPAPTHSHPVGEIPSRPSWYLMAPTPSRSSIITRSTGPLGPRVVAIPERALGA